MPTTTIPINNKCNQLVVTSGIQITTLDGRLTGNNVNFMNFTYNDLKMRRKAEVLKYISQTNTTQNKNYSNLVNSSGYYSRAKLVSFLKNKTQECPGKISSSSCIGVKGSLNNYYYDPNVPYFTSL